MEFLGKVINKDVKVRGVKDDVMFSDTTVEKKYTLFGMNIFKTSIVENITKHAEYFGNEDVATNKLGLGKK